MMNFSENMRIMNLICGKIGLNKLELLPLRRGGYWWLANRVTIKSIANELNVFEKKKVEFD